MITVRNLHYHIPTRTGILQDLEFEVPAGTFLVVLGENGAGKTTLLDLLMGFRKRSEGQMTVMGHDPHSDPWHIRSRLAYLSEKIDMPGDWEVREFLEFNRRFYTDYDVSEEQRLMELFKGRYDDRIGNLSAGEIRRLQIVAAFAFRPNLLIADEITAVLDILGRRQFLKLVQQHQKDRGMTMVLATNIPDGLDSYADHVLLIQQGKQVGYAEIQALTGVGDTLADATVRMFQG